MAATITTLDSGDSVLSYIPRNTTTRADLKDQIKVYNRELSYFLPRIESLKKRLHNLKTDEDQTNKEFGQISEIIRGIHVETELGGALLNNLFSVLSDHNYRRGEKGAQIEREITSYTAKANLLKKSIEKLSTELLKHKDPKETTFSKSDLTERLKKFNVEVNRFVIYHESAYIELITPELTAEVTGFNSDNTPIIQIPQCYLTINLDTREVLINPYNEDGYKYYAEHDTPHPHIMGDNAPCLGDFHSPLAEAIEALDIETAVMLIIEFLSTVNHNDDAGATWPSYYGYTREEVRHGVDSREIKVLITDYLGDKPYLRETELSVTKPLEVLNDGSLVKSTQEHVFFFNDDMTYPVETEIFTGHGSTFYSLEAKSAEEWEAELKAPYIPSDIFTHDEIAKRVNDYYSEEEAA